MRYILLIAAFLISSLAYGQGTWNKSSTNNAWNRTKADSVAIVPRDTSATNNAILPSTGQPVGDYGRIQAKHGLFYFHDSIRNRRMAFYDEFPERLVSSNNIVIYDSLSTYVRSDGATMTHTKDGKILVAWMAYVSGAMDMDTAIIYGAESSDGGLTWSNYRVIANNFDSLGVYVPSLYKKDNGNLILIVLGSNSDSTSRFFQLESTNNGVTWGEPSIIHSEPDTYIQSASNRIFKTSTGRLLFPIQKNLRGGLSSISGVYEGEVLYSDNDGSTWDLMPYTIDSPDSLVAESGFYQIGSVVTMYWRSRSGVVFASNSIDNGDSFGTAYALGLAAPNSLTSIIYNERNKILVGVHNVQLGSIHSLESRATLNTSISTDKGVTWGKGFLIARNLDSNYIEPSILVDNNNMIVSYSSGKKEADANFILQASIIDLNAIRYSNNFDYNENINNQDSVTQDAVFRISGYGAMNGNLIIGGFVSGVPPIDNGSKLQVYGSGYFQNNGAAAILRPNNSPTGNVYLQFNSISNSMKGYLGFSSTGSNILELSNELNDDIAIRTNGGERIRIKSTGLIGINNSSPSSNIDIIGINGYSQFRLRTQYTPTSSADANGNEGDIAVDDNYIYYKTSTGWKRSALTTF